MTQESLQVGERLKASYEALAKETTGHGRRWGSFDGAGDLDDLEAIHAQDWQKLESRAETTTAKHAGSLVEMEARRTYLVSILTDAWSLSDTIRAEWKTPGRRDDWPKLRGDVEAELERKGLPADEIKAQMDLWEGRTPSRLAQEVTGPAEALAQDLHVHARDKIRGLARARLSKAIALFNRHYNQRTETNTDLDAFVRETRSSVDGFLRELWRHLREGTLDAIGSAVNAFCGSAERALFEDGVLLAARLARARRIAPNAVKLGTTARELGTVLCSLLSGIAVGQYAKWLAGWPPAWAPLVEWTKSAKALKFTAKDHPKTAAIADLASDPRRFDGKYLSVEGLCGEVFITHRRKKAISSTVLFDEQGACVRIGKSHMKLDSGGVVRGSYVRVHGRWTMRPGDFNTPVLIVDERNLGAASRRSWTDWVRLETRHIFNPFPNSLELEASWEPGLDGIANLVRYRTWVARDKGRA